jgi:hypothetical protein
MAVAAAHGDHVVVGDRDPVEVEADDGIGSSHERAAEGGKLNLELAQRAVGEQELGRHAPH